MIVRGHILSILDPQLRFSVRGTKGSFVKYGLDVQEGQLKAMKSPKDIFADWFGKEPEEIAGELSLLGSDGSITKERWAQTYIFETQDLVAHSERIIGGRRLRQGHTSSYFRIWPLQSGTARS